MFLHNDVLRPAFVNSNFRVLTFAFKKVCVFAFVFCFTFFDTCIVCLLNDMIKDMKEREVKQEKEFVRVRNTQKPYTNHNVTYRPPYFLVIVLDKSVYF